MFHCGRIIKDFSISCQSNLAHEKISGGNQVKPEQTTASDEIGKFKILQGETSPLKML